MEDMFNQINKESYNKICEEWDKARHLKEINKCIVDFVSLLKSKGRILDVGCGTGYPIDVYLNDMGFNVIGIDISDKMIEKAQGLSLGNCEFINVDLFDFKSNELFDGIIAFDSLWHIAEDKQEMIYPFISKIINSGGFFLFTHGKEKCTIKGEMFGKEFIYSALSKKRIKELLIENGFQIISFIEDYQEETTGTRDLFVIAQKK